ncbi:MAG TPA: hypothetical protein VFT87_03725 [Candidatus Saccharimonadales bacterium]|nr:hypothetical protein [Candidatus Saccharimonadales bacterium]
MKKLDFTKQLAGLRNVGRKLLQHHYFIFTILLLGSLAWAVFAVNQTLNAPSDEAYRLEKLSKSLKANFDKATIEKIESLQKSSEQSQAPPPGQAGARSNPFAE